MSYKWNIICSAVHCFRTVESYLNSENLLKENKEDYNWGEVYLFLSSVDIVIEGINDVNKIAKDNKKLDCFIKAVKSLKIKKKMIVSTLKILKPSLEHIQQNLKIIMNLLFQLIIRHIIF